MDSAYRLTWLIPVLPLTAAFILGIGLIAFDKITTKLRSLASTLSVSMTGASMVLSFFILFSQIQGHDTYLETFEWARAGDFRLSMGLVIDHLTAVMLVNENPLLGTRR